MTKLTDLQLLLLAAAAKRDSRSLLPLPATITTPAGPLARCIAVLAAKGLIEERAVSDPTLAHRQGSETSYGMFITTAGEAAIGIDESLPDQSSTRAPDGPPLPPAAEPVPSLSPDASTPKPERVTKAKLVLDLLRRPEGATLAELVEATGWLPHTTRAALTGLRKKGHAVEKSKRGEVTCYKVAA